MKDYANIFFFQEFKAFQWNVFLQLGNSKPCNIKFNSIDQHMYERHVIDPNAVRNICSLFPSDSLNELQSRSPCKIYKVMYKGNASFPSQKCEHPQTQSPGDKCTHLSRETFGHERATRFRISWRGGGWGVGSCLWVELVSIARKSKPGVSALQWGMRRALMHQWRANGPALEHTDCWQTETISGTSGTLFFKFLQHFF